MSPDWKGGRGMRLGYCASLDGLEAVQRAGFAYVELRVVDLVSDDDEAVYAPIRRRIQDVGLPAEAFNVFIPPHHPVVGPRRDLPALRAYLDTAMGRMAELGACLVVFGSGPARATPPGYDRHRVPGQIFEFLALAADAAAPYDLDIVIEPLWREKCDTINTVLEAVVVARQSGIPRVAALADWWHMVHEREPLSNLPEARDRLRHVHVPVPPLPGSPPQSTDAGLPEFLRVLTAMDYTGRISIEDNGKRIESIERQAPDALAYLRAHLRR